MKRRIAALLLCVLAFVIVLDFIPVKFAKTDETASVVFVNEPKLGSEIEWASFEYDNGTFDYDSMIGYFVEGKAPDKVLSENDFDKVDLYTMRGDHTNKFLIFYDEKTEPEHSGFGTVYQIHATDWEILYPIRRASFRRFYVPKNYLTVYDYNWIEVLKGIFE